MNTRYSAVSIARSPKLPIPARAAEARESIFVIFLWTWAASASYVEKRHNA